MDPATVGGFFLSAFLQVLFDRIAPHKFQELFPKQYEFDDQVINKLKRKLRVFQAVLEDAETKQSKNGAVRDWLEELQEVLYQADDLLDQISTEALRVKVESQYPSPTNRVSSSTAPSYLSFGFLKNFRPSSTDHVTDPSYFSVEFLKEIMPKLEKILHKLEDFENEIAKLGLIKKDLESPKKQPFRPPSTSVVDENDVYGRDSDRDNIIGELLCDHVPIGKNVSVISFVGLGGVGKTTLAQFVYSDERVHTHFDTKAWVCVSEEFDAIRITKDLLNELSIRFDSNDTFNSLQIKLKQELSSKRFFLVLDDVWEGHYDHWSNLSTLFNSGKNGSKIIVTTRDEKVAHMIHCPSVNYNLNKMSDEACWSLFSKHAFINREAVGNLLEFESVGREIVKKCGGLPLAIKAVAGLLRSKQTIEEWKKVSRSDEWDRPSNQGVILPSLKLSYAHLEPPNLKQCFAYCAIFHKDYRFSKHEVILLWMANDLLLESPRSNKRPEDIGDEFFDELRSRSLFQQSGEGKFSMHDLVNDLAKVASGKYFVRLEDHQQENGSLIAARHFSYLSSSRDVFERLKPLNESKLLRTFLPLHFDQRSGNYKKLSQKFLLEVLPASKSLRVLSLSGYGITGLLDSFADLKQLRFLNLCHTLIRELPNWICTFYNLQTLLLTGCRCLKEISEDIKKLINLRHLDVNGVPLSKMPMEIGRLKNLQFLPKFVVSKCSGSSIEELGKLCNLHGELTIDGLQNVADCKNASMANVKGKEYIKKLTLVWNGDSDDSQLARDVLENLEAPSDIEHLEIQGYTGTSFPDWLGYHSFEHMISLSLSNCENCFCLPAIGQLPYLERLTISGLSKVIEIGQEFYGITKPIFPCLKKLCISGMEEWMTWHIPDSENGVFSCLEELRIFNCPKLIGKIPKQLQSLRKFEIERCPELIGEIPEQLPSLRELKIANCPKLMIGEEFVEQIQSVTELSIGGDCPWLVNSNGGLTTNDSSMVLPNLERLCIRKCRRLSINDVPRKLRRLTLDDNEVLELETSEMVNIEELKIYSSSVSVKNLSLGSLPNLRRLTLEKVKNMEELSIPDANQNLTSLQSLWISDCLNFSSFPIGGLPAPNLTEIELGGLPELKSLPERMHAFLPSLRRFYLKSCPNIECFPEGGLPSSLQYLIIDGDCRRLWSCCREWGLTRLHSLTDFYFNEINEEETLPPEDLQLPSTLTSLDFLFCHNLKTLNYRALQHLTCLQSIRIWGCDELRSLPEEGLPASLTRLEIEGCKLLTQRLEWKKGEDWPKVEHIPCIRLDEKLFP